MTEDSIDLIDHLKSASEGNEQKLTELLSKYRGRLRHMVSLRLDRRLQGRVDPSDVIQEAFLEASLRLENYLTDPSMPFYLWLRFITAQKLNVLHRRHLGTLQRDARRDVSIYDGRLPEVSSAVLAAQLVGRQSTPSKPAQRSEQKLRLQQALDDMEPIDREILVLRNFEELSNSDCAQLLSISPTAANNRYVRALRRLGRILASMPGGIEEMLP